MRYIIVAIVALICSVSRAESQALFADNFEGTLSSWVGKNGGSHNGVIVTDPLKPTNHVLAFTALNSGGDVYGPEIAVTPWHTYVLTFDYLGRAVDGSPPGNFGGFIGISDATPGPHGPASVVFLGATIHQAGVIQELFDTGGWSTYTMLFTPNSAITVPDGTIRITVQDWGGDASCACPAGVVGDVYFDNIYIMRLGPVATEASTWGKVKALYR